MVFEAFVCEIGEWLFSNAYVEGVPCRMSSIRDID